jgi:type I pantothenate kinase
MSGRGEDVAVSRFVEFSRAEWARLRAATPLPLTEPQLRGLVSLNEKTSLDEVADIYLPLSRLLNLYVAAKRNLHTATATFLGSQSAHIPFVIGLAGSVAVGKSTASRLLQALLSRWPSHPKVDLVTTDGFLFPLATLETRGLTHRKGFPESYDLRRLVHFMAELKSGVPEVQAPVYSHLRYDIVPGEYQVVRRPDIVIVEGLNVLQTGSGRAGRPMPMFVSDFFDFSIYVDACGERYRAVVHRAFPGAAGNGLHERVLILSSLRCAQPRRVRRDGAATLDLDQSRKSAREHPADARTRASHPGERPRSRRAPGATAEAVIRKPPAEIPPPTRWRAAAPCRWQSAAARRGNPVRADNRGGAAVRRA